MKPVSPKVIRYAAAVLSALLLAAAFPPLGWRPLAWVALAPWFALLLRDRGIGHRGPAFAFGFVFFTAGLWWLAKLTLIFPPAVALLLALYPLLFAVLVRLASPLGTVRTALLLPPLWIGVDLLRQHLLTGFPWLLPGHVAAGWPDLRQAADLGGAHLLTFLVLLANAAGGLWGAHLLRTDRNAGVSMGARCGAVAAALLLPVLCSAYGSSRRDGMHDRAGPRVLLVQPSFPQAIKGEAMKTVPAADEMRRRQLELSLDGVRQHPDTDLVVWAETMIPGELRQQSRDRTGTDPETRRTLEDLADSMGVVPGGTRRFLGGAVIRDADRGLRNAALLVGADGAVAGRFDKVRMVPFGEYLPLLWLLPSAGRERVRDWVHSFSPIPELLPGEAHPAALDIPGPFRVHLGGLICYEVIFPELARERVREGADVLVNLSNYAWYGAGMQEQALDMTRLRAVETRRPVVIATNDGPTAVLDGNGEVRSRLDTGARGVLFAEVPLDGRDTLYLRTGDLFGWLAAALGLLGVALGTASGRRSRGETPGNPPETLKNC